MRIVYWPGLVAVGLLVSAYSCEHQLNLNSVREFKFSKMDQRSIDFSEKQIINLKNPVDTIEITNGEHATVEWVVTIWAKFESDLEKADISILG